MERQHAKPYRQIIYQNNYGSSDFCVDCRLLCFFMKGQKADIQAGTMLRPAVDRLTVGEDCLKV